MIEKSRRWAKKFRFRLVRGAKACWYQMQKELTPNSSIRWILNERTPGDWDAEIQTGCCCYALDYISCTQIIYIAPPVNPWHRYKDGEWSFCPAESQCLWSHESSLECPISTPECGSILCPSFPSHVYCESYRHTPTPFGPNLLSKFLCKCLDLGWVLRWSQTTMISRISQQDGNAIPKRSSAIFIIPRPCLLIWAKPVKLAVDIIMLICRNWNRIKKLNSCSRLASIRKILNDERYSGWDWTVNRMDLTPSFTGRGHVIPSNSNPCCRPCLNQDQWPVLFIKRRNCIAGETGSERGPGGSYVKEARPNRSKAGPATRQHRIHVVGNVVKCAALRPPLPEISSESSWLIWLFLPIEYSFRSWMLRCLATWWFLLTHHWSLQIIWSYTQVLFRCTPWSETIFCTSNENIPIENIGK